MGIIYIILIFILIAVVSAGCFYFLLYPRLNIKETFKLIVVASALNRLFFTGSGYLTSSYLSRNKNLPFSCALSAFLLLEFLGTGLWVVLGVYFGVKLAIKTPGLFVLIMAFLLLIGIFQRKKFIKFTKTIFEGFKNMGRRIPLVIPFIILNTILFVSYYFFLFQLFNFHPPFLTIIKIISVSFTIGYLSFAPSGLGFKDAGFITLLMKAGLTFKSALGIAIFDRIFVAVFWAILGSIFGYGLIKEELALRFKKK